MRRRIPSLSALATFEASAKMMSFTSAAESLFVTQTAVSHQIRLLEDYLGVMVFRRVGRTLMLTDEGRTLLPVVTDALDRIEEAVNQITMGMGSRTVTALVPIDFTSTWLKQRLNEFWNKWPEIDLRIHEAVRIANFARDDIAIYWGRGLWPDLESTLLLKTDYTVICNPLVAENHAKADIADILRTENLLHKDNFDMWGSLLEHMDVSDKHFPRGSIFDDISSLLLAVENGRGIAVVKTVFVADALQEGRIVSLARCNLEPDTAYYLVHPPGEKRTRVLAFKDFFIRAAQDNSDRYLSLL